MRKRERERRGKKAERERERERSREREREREKERVHLVFTKFLFLVFSLFFILYFAHQNYAMIIFAKICNFISTTKMRAKHKYRRRVRTAKFKCYLYQCKRRKKRIACGLVSFFFRIFVHQILLFI